MLILVTSLACSATLSSHDCTAGNYRLLVIINPIDTILTIHSKRKLEKMAAFVCTAKYLGKGLLLSC